MYITLKQRYLIEQIANKLAHSDVEPISFFEYYVEFNLSKMLNEQNTLTNWFQNLGNYFKGGMSNVYKRQVDISSKFQDAKKSLEAIMQVIQSFKNVDPQYADDLLNHINTIVDTMKSSEPAIKTLGDKIMVTHEEPKMTGRQRNWHPSEQINAQLVQNMPLVFKTAEVPLKSMEFFVALDGNHKQYMANMADYAAKNVPQNLYKLAQNSNVSSLTAFAPVVRDEAHAKNILAVLLNNYYKYKIKPIQDLGVGTDYLDDNNWQTIKTKLNDSTLANNLKQIVGSIPKAKLSMPVQFKQKATAIYGTGMPSVTLDEFNNIASYIFKMGGLLRNLKF